MKLIVHSTQPHERGRVYSVAVEGNRLKILLTFHALGRMAKWRLTDEVVLQALLDPEEVLRGHHNRFIAHRRARGHVVRVIYEYEKALPVVITVYNPAAERYFKGGETYEDRILT
jgi:hypothetical protein